MPGIHDKLNAFIDHNAPELGRFLYRMWQDEQKVITYKELREAILDGSLSLTYLDDWRQDYSHFLLTCYTPLVNQAVRQAAEDMRAMYGVNFYDPAPDYIESFIRRQGGTLIREVSEEQYKAINQLVRRATLTEGMTVDQLAEAIRPCVGLTRRQAAPSFAYYQNLIEQGYKHEYALKRQITFAARTHRKRAAMIAQTEMAFAYNAGWNMTVRQNVIDGVLPTDTKKVWDTAYDERVCDECGGLDGETVLWSEVFSNGVSVPPAHPRCRCSFRVEFGSVLREPEMDKTQQRDTYDDGDTELTQEESTEEASDEGLLSEAGDSIIETEESTRPIQGDLPESINVDEVYSQRFRDKCHTFFDDPATGDRVTEMAREILAHRNGTTFEDLILFDGDTGERIFSLNYKDAPFSVEYDDRIRDAITQARKEKRSIISLHNHPDSTPPSADDAVSALVHGYSGGIVVGHNGKIYGFNPATKRLTKAECEETHKWIAYQIGNGSGLLQTWTEMLREKGITIWEVL